MTKFIQRIRDPIHGLISFHDDTDEIAWKLIECSVFQRLRRIRQLGFSEFTFPSATHTRFAHSIGVYANAKKLMQTVKIAEGSNFDKDRAHEVLIAALLHDIGHGPFSHAFEEVRKSIFLKNGGNPSDFEDHESYTAKFIADEKSVVQNILEKNKLDFKKISGIFEKKNPEDIYHAVISSSFDADRLDFLVRDRYMTGTGAGAIDVDWLIDNLTECTVFLSQDDDEPTKEIKTFAFKFKGRQAAEDFLLARYRLYKEVYLHKTTRGFEMMLIAVLKGIVAEGFEIEKHGLDKNDPLIQFLSGNENIELYQKLDDFSVWSLLKKLSISAESSHLGKIARRIIDREHSHVIDVTAECQDDAEKLKNSIDRLDSHVGDDLNKTVFVDRPSVNLYSADDGEVEKAHKVVRVLGPDGKPKEITDFDEKIISDTLTKKKPLIRYYFLDEKQKWEAGKAMGGR